VDIMKVPIMMNDSALGVICGSGDTAPCTRNTAPWSDVRTLPDVMKDSPQADKIREEYKCQTGVE